MKAAAIAAELGEPIEEAAEETRYALAKQVGSIGFSMDSAYGPIRLLPDESAEIQSFTRRVLEARLANLEGRG